MNASQLREYILLRRGSSSGSARPDPIMQPAFAPPFDANSGGNVVHTELPPEQIIPPPFTDRTFLVADFTGVEFTGDYEPKPIRRPDGSWDSSPVINAGGVTMTSGPWKGMFVKFLQQANSTPPTALMTPCLPMYERKVQVAHLTEHAWRGHQDFIISDEVWGAAANGRTFSIQEIVDWTTFAKVEFGFRPVLWRGNASLPRDGSGKLQLDAMLQTLLDKDLVSFLVYGKEVDTQMTSEDYEAHLQYLNQRIGGSVPIGVHFSADWDREMGYPIGMPRETFIPDWAPYDGRVHLCMQLLGYKTTPQGHEYMIDAGIQGASMYYARQHVNIGQGPAAPAGAKGAPNSRVIAFETMATAKLYGLCPEAYGRLRSWELLCGTRNDPRVRPVSGTCDGGGYPDGYWLAPR